MPLFDYYARHPAAGRVSVEGLRSIGRGEDEAVASGYDFSKATTIVDLGGGQGGLLAAILRAVPEARGTLFGLPHVMDAARRQFEQAGVATRVRQETGDFFKSVPAGGDVYLLRKVLHDWDDDKARAILQVCRSAMTANARLLIVETLVAPGNVPCHAKELDLLMLVYTGGRERTEQEFRELLDRRCAQADQHLGLVIRKALKVAPHPTQHRRLRQRVARQGEVVETDGKITASEQELVPADSLGKALGAAGQRPRIDPALARDQVRHMGISEQRDTVGREIRGQGERIVQVLPRLARQAVH
jgi:hypothetical protein